MSEHFKLEITNRSIRITIFSGVSENFAQEYYEMLSPRDGGDDSPIDLDNMTPAMRTIFENAGHLTGIFLLACVGEERGIPAETLRKHGSFGCNGAAGVIF